MLSVRQIGGISALIDASTFIVGFALFFTLLGESGYGDIQLEAMTQVQFLQEHQLLMQLWNLIIYVVFGIFVVVQALALQWLIREKAPFMANVIGAFGIIWGVLVIASGMVANVGMQMVLSLNTMRPDEAGELWQAVHTLENGLGGGNEIVGGVWIMLIGLASLRFAILPKALSWLGVIVGVSGLCTVIPSLEDAGAIFGLGSIVWFLWLGIALLKKG